jgi:hypothetical protein
VTYYTRRIIELSGSDLNMAVRYRSRTLPGDEAAIAVDGMLTEVHHTAEATHITIDNVRITIEDGARHQEKVPLSTDFGDPHWGRGM